MSHKLTFERKEEEKAYLKNDDNKTIVLPVDYIGKEIKEGEVIYLNISKEDNSAKDVLNELLK